MKGAFIKSASEPGGLHAGSNGYVPYDLLENAHALSRLTSLSLGIFVRDPDFRQKAAGMKSGQNSRVDLIGLHSHKRSRGPFSNSPRPPA
jgi:hypothetical protein